MNVLQNEWCNQHGGYITILIKFNPSKQMWSHINNTIHN